MKHRPAQAVFRPHEVYIVPLKDGIPEKDWMESFLQDSGAAGSQLVWFVVEGDPSSVLWFGRNLSSAREALKEIKTAHPTPSYIDQTVYKIGVGYHEKYTRHDDKSLKETWK